MGDSTRLPHCRSLRRTRSQSRAGCEISGLESPRARRAPHRRSMTISRMLGGPTVDVQLSPRDVRCSVRTTCGVGGPTPDRADVRYEQEGRRSNSFGHQAEVAEPHEAMGPEYVLSAFQMELISGGVDAKGIQSVIRRAEEPFYPDRRAFDPMSDDVSDVLRGIHGLSAIAHGVDVETLNAIVFAGMPSDVTEYLQASSGSADHVGSLCWCLRRRHGAIGSWSVSTKRSTACSSA